MLLFLAAGIAMRGLVTLAYWPGLELNGDSYTYLENAHALHPESWHPLGYALLLRIIAVTGSLGVVTVIQHLMGVVMAIVIYLFLLRLGVRRPLAAIATLPVLLDAYQLDIEQFILAETLVDVLLLAGLAILFWRKPMTAPWAGLVGFFLAAATLTRTAALPILAVVGFYLLIRRWWRLLFAFSGVGLAILLAYGAWYGTTNGSFGYSDYGGYMMYGLTAPLATCDYKLPPAEARLCPRQPVSQRSQDSEFYIWHSDSPLYQRGLGDHQQRNVLAKRFSKQIILHQPLDYLAAVVGGTWHYFTPGRWMTSDRIELQRFRFPLPNIHGTKNDLHVAFASEGIDLQPITPSVHPALMRPLRDYQAVAYTQGPVLLVALLLGLAVGFPLVRRSGRRRARWAALVFAVSGFVIVLVPSFAVAFSYRYGLPLLILLPPAGVIGFDVGLDRVLRPKREPLSDGPPSDQDTAGQQSHASPERRRRPRHLHVQSR
jgi:hypothetical protein